MKVALLVLAVFALPGCEYVLDTSVQVTDARAAVRDASTLEQFSANLAVLGFACDEVKECDEFCIGLWEYDFTSEAERELLRQADQMLLCWWEETSGSVIKTTGRIRAAAFATDGELTVSEITDKYLGP